MIVAYQAKDRAVFLAGLAKNELDNISHDQSLELRKVGANWLNATAKETERDVRDGILQEVLSDQEKASQPA